MRRRLSHNGPERPGPDMSTKDRSVAPPSALPTGLGSRPSSVLHLQALAGNRAVTSLVVQRNAGQNVRDDLAARDRARSLPAYPRPVGFGGPEPRPAGDVREMRNTTSSLKLFDLQTGNEVGDLTYSYERFVDAAYLNALGVRSDRLVASLVGTTTPVLVIYGFHAYPEQGGRPLYRGTGTPLLRALVELAKEHVCPGVFVMAGINREVYQALGFELVSDAGMGVWWTRTSALEQRLRGTVVRQIPLPGRRHGAADSPASTPY